MCRILCAHASAEFETAPHLAALAAIARDSPEYQGHGWGCAWREDGRWRIYRDISPIWEDPNRPAARTTLLLAHARSAFRDEGIAVENNMPFRNGERVFAFNGELRGVRIRERGRTGAEKIFNTVLRFEGGRGARRTGSGVHQADLGVHQVDLGTHRGDLGAALTKGVAAIERRTRYVRAMNIVVAEPLRIHVASRFNETPDYFRMHKGRVQMKGCVGEVQVVCSQPYPADFGPGQWTPVPEGTVQTFEAGATCC